MRVAIIGAGAAGLASARHVAAQGYDCDLLELKSELGGTWVYTDEVGTDKDGFPIYSAMYKGLRTNLPKEIMCFPDFEIADENKSYLTRMEVLQFFNDYADHFDIRRLIKFNRMVMDIRPYGETQWIITSIDKPTKKEIVDIYDAVMVCNGHYNEPIVPKLEGQEKFKGQIIHSMTYRSSDKFKGGRILVIGAGPSGLDLTLALSKVAKYVVQSFHSKEATNTEYPTNVIKKPDIVRIKNEEEVEFVDGSCCRFDTIILCTGYRYSFPFLHESCGITVDENFIQPLYKHMIHIERPTMCFIGIPTFVCAFKLFDLQARFYCQYLNGCMKLPSAHRMRMETDMHMKNRWDMGYTKKNAHMMGESAQCYYDDLANTANIEPIAPVFSKLYQECVDRLYNDLENFRRDKYKILDNNNYVKVH